MAKLMSYSEFSFLRFKFCDFLWLAFYYISSIRRLLVSSFHKVGSWISCRICRQYEPMLSTKLISKSLVHEAIVKFLIVIHYLYIFTSSKPFQIHPIRSFEGPRLRNSVKKSCKS